MGQLTLYLDPETEFQLSQAAKAANLSKSRFVANLIRTRTRSEWPAEVVELIGSLDDGYPSLDEIRETAPDSPRERL